MSAGVEPRQCLAHTGRNGGKRWKNKVPMGTASYVRRDVGCSECWVRTKGCEPNIWERISHWRWWKEDVFIPSLNVLYPFIKILSFHPLCLSLYSRASFLSCASSSSSHLSLKYVLPTWNTSKLRGTLLNTSVNDDGAAHALWDGLECVWARVLTSVHSNLAWCVRHWCT